MAKYKLEIKVTKLLQIILKEAFLENTKSFFNLSQAFNTLVANNQSNQAYLIS